ncbi:hypothetical protein EJB05_46994 [Eragrostis curvula]|uniref:Dynamin-type G domain-containing protein n=1 Tax=Eragrostis curvula TaxID=38414 RepID=A0A5J9T6V1_9POAL|nr:hypothetical protein EJB05_46994 [Eragrostis curvula]
MPPPPPTSIPRDAAELQAQFEAYSRLHAAAAALGEKLPIPEIVVIGGLSDGKSSLMEALLGFRFNLREGTRRPLVVHMVHDPTAVEPRCRFQEEDSEEYGSPMEAATAIADLIKQRTVSHLGKINAAVSSKPIVMRAEYATAPISSSSTLQAKRDEPEGTPEEIKSMVKKLASPSHRLLLFLQQSSVQWNSSIWLHTIKDIDPTFRRTMIVISKFDNRLKEFSARRDVDSFLGASGYLADNIHPFCVAIPMDMGTISNKEFRRRISQEDTIVLRHLRNMVEGGFDEEKYGSYIGFSCLKKCLESELDKRYKEAAPATLALLEQRCTEVSMDLARLDSKLKATSDVSQLRRSATFYINSIWTHLRALLDGTIDPVPGTWGYTTDEEQFHSGIGSWPGINMPVKPANSTLRLHGGAAFERVMNEFHCAIYSMNCPQVSREKVAEILLAHAGRGVSSGLTEAAAEIARAGVRSSLAPLIDIACDRLAFVLQNLFDLAMERHRRKESQYQHNVEDMGGYVDFRASLRCSYNMFVKELSKQCKQIVRHHLDSVTSPTDLSDSGSVQDESHEHVPPKDQQHMTPPHDLPGHDGEEKGNEIPNDVGPRKRHARMEACTGRNHHNNGIIGADDMGSKSGYSTICVMSAQFFAKMRDVLIERNVPSSGFLTSWRKNLSWALFEVLAVDDEKFMHIIRNEHQSLLKRQEILQSCLNDFKDISWP